MADRTDPLPPPTAPPANPPRAARRVRRTVETIVLLLAVGLILRTWCLQGLLVPFQITSGSMAETLLGPHRELTCGDCGASFFCGGDLQPVHAQATCPNCGYGENDLPNQPEIAGDRLMIDRSAFRFRSPRRWEVVAFRSPERASEVCVKRVVGLPGETVQIQDGDVYINGAIVRKTLAQQRVMAILVHDAAHPARLDPALPPRWQADSSRSQWTCRDGVFTHPGRSKNEEPLDSQAVDWLTYHHWERLPCEPGRVREAPVFSRCAYNQGGVQRAQEVRPVPDLLLSFRLVCTIGPSGTGRLWLRATDGQEEFQVAIAPNGGGCQVLRNGKPAVLDSSPAVNTPLDGVLVEASLFDQQFLLTIDGRPTILIPYEREKAASEPALRPFSIGTDGMGVEIRDLRLFRDVYYTRPLGFQDRWGGADQVRLGWDEYFVLGDNSPVSDDSRTWRIGPGLSGGLLLGKPLLVHLPCRALGLGGWTFQVPDMGRIRYIR